MTVEFAVRITDEDGNPVQGAEVDVQYTWATDSGITDEEGRVRFERTTAFGDAVRTTIYVNGELRDQDVWIENENTCAYSI